MLPSPSLPPTCLPQSSICVLETDFLRCRKSALLRKEDVLERFELRGWAAGRVAEPRGDPIIEAASIAPPLAVRERSAWAAAVSSRDTNSALDETMTSAW